MPQVWMSGKVLKTKAEAYLKRASELDVQSLASKSLTLDLEAYKYKAKIDMLKGTTFVSFSYARREHTNVPQKMHYARVILDLIEKSFDGKVLIDEHQAERINELVIEEIDVAVEALRSYIAEDTKKIETLKDEYEKLKATKEEQQSRRAMASAKEFERRRETAEDRVAREFKEWQVCVEKKEREANAATPMTWWVVVGTTGVVITSLAKIFGVI